MRKLLILCGSLLWINSLIAAPTLNGPTGLIMVPTAESLQYKEMNVGLDYKLSNNKQRHFYKFNFGEFKGVELGIVGGSVPTEGVFVNAKYYLMSDNTRFPLSIALGVENLGAKNSTGVYMVASKKFQGGISGHFGFYAGFEEGIDLDPSIMGGAEWVLDNRISLLADVVGKRRKYTLNTGLRFAIYPDLQFRAAILDLGNNLDENIYTVGLTYSSFL
jgi:hypothetical protein